MLLAVGDPLVTPRQLRQLPRDVVLLSEDALLDLDDRVTALAQLGLELGAQLDRLLPRLDAGLAAGRFRVAARLLEISASARGEPSARLDPDWRRSTSSVKAAPAASAIRTATTSMGAPTGLRPHTTHSADRRSPARVLARRSISAQVVWVFVARRAGRIED